MLKIFFGRAVAIGFILLLCAEGSTNHKRLVYNALYVLPNLLLFFFLKSSSTISNICPTYLNLPQSFLPAINTLSQEVASLFHASLILLSLSYNSSKILGTSFLSMINSGCMTISSIVETLLIIEFGCLRPSTCLTRNCAYGILIHYESDYQVLNVTVLD